MTQIASARFASASSESPVRGNIDAFFVYDGLERLRLEDAAIVPPGFDLEIAGWATIGEPPRSAAALTAYAGTKRIRTVWYDLPRADVATHFGSDAVTNCGFRIVVDPDALDLPHGTSEIRVLLDGSCEVFRFTIHAARPRSRETGVSERFSYKVLDIRGHGGEPNIDRRIERGFVAVVRGTLRDGRGEGLPDEIHCIVNKIAAYPVMIEDVASDGTIAFLAYVPTDTLPPGPASVRFSTRASSHVERETSDSHPFTVSPICVRESSVPSSELPAPAAIVWQSGSERPDVLAARRGEILTVQGWIVDALDGCATAAAYLVFDDGQQFALDVGAHSLEAARELDSKYAIFAGFVGSVSTAKFADGRHVGRVHAISGLGATAFVSDATVTLEIVG